MLHGVTCGGGLTPLLPARLDGPGLDGVCACFENQEFVLTRAIPNPNHKGG